MLKVVLHWLLVASVVVAKSDAMGIPNCLNVARFISLEGFEIFFLIHGVLNSHSEES